MHTILLILLLLFYLIHHSSCYTVTITMNFTGGDDLCAPSNNNCPQTTTWMNHYACSDGRGSWNDGSLSFHDPIPPSQGYVLQNVNATLYGRFYCNTTHEAVNLLVLLQGTLSLLFVRGMMR
jgi:hypothetical protein